MTHLSPRRTRIGVDCDGVIGDLGSLVVARINSELGVNLQRSDITTFHIEDSYGESRDQAHRILREMLNDPETWANVPLMPDGVEALRILADEFDVYMVSAIWYRYHPIRQEWVRRHGLPITKVLCATDKAAMCLKYGISAFVEDRQENARSVSSAGIGSYLVAHPYNESESGIIRAEWPGITDSIRSLFGRSGHS